MKDKLKAMQEDFKEFLAQYKDNFDFIDKFFPIGIKGLFRTAAMIMITEIYVSGLLVDKVFDTITIEREFHPPKAKKIILPPELLTDTLVTEPDQQALDALKEYLANFIEIIKKNFPEDCLKLFFKNLASLQVTKIDSFEKNSQSRFELIGLYNTLSNKITVVNEARSHVVFHELFHMASSYYDEQTQTEYCGFSQNTGDEMTFGKGLNEGYTEIITTYFADEADYDQYTWAYEYEKKAAKVIEMVVGQVRTAHFYLKADLNGLINVLEKYESRENIITFIHYLDFINKYTYEKRKSTSLKSKLQKCDTFIQEFLLKISFNRITEIIKSPGFNEKFQNNEWERLKQIATFYSQIFYTVSLPEEKIIEYINTNSDFTIKVENKIVYITSIKKGEKNER